MKYDQGSVLTTLHRVQSFLRANADRLGGLATSGASTKIDESATSLEARGREQACHTLAATMGTAKRNAARRALVTRHMYPIAYVAAAELEDYDALPVFHMPRTDVDDKALIQKARAMVFAAVAREPAFSRSLASADFAADLTKAAETFSKALQERADSVAGRENATAALAGATRIARKRLRVIHRLVVAATANDPALVVEWNGVKRIAKASGAIRADVGGQHAGGSPAAATRQRGG